MSYPAPGFPFEAIASSAASAFEEGVGSGGEDKFHFFDAVPIEYTEVNATSGVANWQYGIADTSSPPHPVRTRNATNSDIEIGDRVVIMLDANGLGVLLVLLCEA